MTTESIKAKSALVVRPEKSFQHGVLRRLVEGIMFFRDGEKTFFEPDA